jgi:hypothetical protein
VFRQQDLGREGAYLRVVTKSGWRHAGHDGAQEQKIGLKKQAASLVVAHIGRASPADSREGGSRALVRERRGSAVKSANPAACFPVMSRNDMGDILVVEAELPRRSRPLLTERQ